MLGSFKSLERRKYFTLQPLYTRRCDYELALILDRRGQWVLLMPTYTHSTLSNAAGCHRPHCTALNWQGQIRRRQQVRYRSPWQISVIHYCLGVVRLWEA